MECYTGLGILLLAIIAALFFLLKSKNENAGALTKWIAWLVIFIAFISITCMLYNCWRGGCCFGGTGCGNDNSCSMPRSHHGDMMWMEKECGHEDAEMRMAKSHCCMGMGDSTHTEKVFVDESGDTIRIEKKIRVIVDDEKKKDN
ncbi:MAG: hypothetical protein ACHQNT_01550 [Bacteroidia bacterium]